MKRKFLAAAAAVIGLYAGAAHAAEFNFTFSGSTLYFDSYPIMDNSPCPEVEPSLAICNLPYFGQLHVIVSSGADGTYTGADVEKFLLQSNLDGFAYSYGDVPELETRKSGYEYVGMTLYPSVTISGGQVTDLSFFYQYLFGTASGKGLSFVDNDGGPYFSYFGGASLTAVPEAPTVLMLACGLLALAVRRRRQ